MTEREGSVIAGTHLGGLKAGLKNKERYGEDYYRVIGKAGGKTSTGGGFAKMDSQRVRELGAKGGSASKRPKPKDSQYEQIKEASQKRKRKWLIF